MLAIAIGIAGPLVSQYEGYETRVYLDTGNVPTVCTGHTGPDVRPGDTWTDEMCDKARAKDLHDAAVSVAKYAKVPMYEYEFAALVSFVFNVGPTQFKNSTLLRKLNAGDYTGACNELPRWVYDNGKKLRGLVKRRDAERKLCLGE